MSRELVATLTAQGAPAGTAVEETFVLEGPMRLDGAAAAGNPERYALVRIVDGQRQDAIAVDAKRVRGNQWSIIIDLQAFTVDVDPRKLGAAVVCEGSSGVVVLEEAARKRLAKAMGKGGAKTAGEIVRAPIAGKVVKVVVALGDVVAVGSPVIVLEAMKMENELVAERGGTVKRIAKEAGQAVEIGELLVELA